MSAAQKRETDVQSTNKVSQKYTQTKFETTQKALQIYYLLFLTQRRDDVAQGDERLVYVPSLFQADARRTSGVSSLAAGQIDQVDLTDRLTGHLCIELSLTERERYKMQLCLTVRMK